MPLAVFEPTITASEWPQTHALDRSATGIGAGRIMSIKIRMETYDLFIIMNAVLLTCD